MKDNSQLHLMAMNSLVKNSVPYLGQDGRCFIRGNVGCTQVHLLWTGTMPVYSVAYIVSLVGLTSVVLQCPVELDSQTRSKVKELASAYHIEGLEALFPSD